MGCDKNLIGSTENTKKPINENLKIGNVLCTGSTRIFNHFSQYFGSAVQRLDANLPVNN